MKISVDLAD